MSFKLSEAEIKQRDELLANLNSATNALDDAVREYNEAVDKLREPLDAVVAGYNEIVNQAQAFAEDIANTADGEISDKSEKWQDGEKGQAAIAFKDAWECLGHDLREITINYPDELDVDAPTHADDLEAAPVEAEG